MVKRFSRSAERKLGSHQTLNFRPGGIPERLAPRNFFELAAFAVFPDAVPGKTLTVYGNVNSGRQCLHERERAAKIEETVGTAKGVGDHRSGKDHGFFWDGLGERGGGGRHGIGAVSDDDLILLGLNAVLHDESAIVIGHFEAVDQHHGADGHLDLRSSQPEHLRDVGLLEVELAGAFVVFLIKRAAGNENTNGHGKEKAESGER